MQELLDNEERKSDEKLHKELTEWPPQYPYANNKCYF